MTIRLVALICYVAAAPCAADTVLAARTLKAGTIIEPRDVVVKGPTIPGAFVDVGDVLGMETRVAIYAGRPLRKGDIGPPALIERNDIVIVKYSTSGLSISTEGRALSRGGVGDEIRIMNLASRTTVFGTIAPDGTALIQR